MQTMIRVMTMVGLIPLISMTWAMIYGQPTSPLTVIVEIRRGFHRAFL